jgi:hypothetical protein
MKRQEIGMSKKISPLKASPKEQKRFFDALRQLEGQPFWDGGGGIGSMLALNFGKKIAPGAAKKVRRFIGEYHIWVQGASWRFILQDGSMTSNFDEMHENVNACFQKAINSVVTSVEVNAATFDLILIFENGCRLDIFNNTTEEFDVPNYSFSHYASDGFPIDGFTIDPNAVFLRHKSSKKKRTRRSLVPGGDNGMPRGK